MTDESNITSRRFGNAQKLTPQQVLAEALGDCSTFRAVIVVAIEGEPGAPVVFGYSAGASVLERIAALEIAQQQLVGDGMPK